MNVCKASVNNTQKVCQNSPIKDSQYCIFHHCLYNTNNECPICLCEINQNVKTPKGVDDVLLLTPCYHYIHYKCAKQQISLCCPICRQIVDNYPFDIKTSITQNERTYQSKLDAQDLQEAQRISDEVNAVTQGITKIPPHVEIFIALTYLKKMGIPAIFLPIGVNITIHKKAPPHPEGTLFQAIVGNVMELIEHKIMEAEGNFEDHNEGNFEYHIEGNPEDHIEGKINEDTDEIDYECNDTLPCNVNVTYI